MFDNSSSDQLKRDAVGFVMAAEHHALRSDTRLSTIAARCRLKLLWFHWVSLITAASCLGQAQPADDVPTLWREIRRAIDAHDHERSCSLLTSVIKVAPDDANAWYTRGRERFRMGKVKESLADFDRYVQLRPELKSRQWERGIACYYAQQYQRGADQFQLYQSYHNNDVENSVWRYLCVAKLKDAEKARSDLLPIENDRRNPMMQIYRMYRGEMTPENVLEATLAGNPSEEILRGRQFYAELYIGLYYESWGKADEALVHVKKAADQANRNAPNVNSYMWDVARVHLELLNKKSAGQ